MNNNRILIINPFGIGDVIFSLPLVEAIKDAFPGSFVGYVCNKRSFEVIKTNPRIDSFFVYEKDDFRACWSRSKVECIKELGGLLSSIKKCKFNILIDLSLGYQYSMFLMFLGVSKRVGFNYRDRGRFLTDGITISGFSEKHVVLYYLDMLKLLGISPEKYVVRPKVYLSNSDNTWADIFFQENGVGKGDIVVGVMPGCGASWGSDAKYRHWPREEFAKVCDSLIEKVGAKIILFGDIKEVKICSDIKAMMKGEPIIACGKTSLRDFLGLLKKCDVVITNDGGPLHMAVASGVKTVSIFGPVDENIYGPYPLTADHIVLSMKGLACRPCYKKFKHDKCESRSCLAGIKAEDVVRAAETLLSGAMKYA